MGINIFMGSWAIIYIIFGIWGVFCIGIASIFKARNIFLNTICFDFLFRVLGV